MKKYVSELLWSGAEKSDLKTKSKACQDDLWREMMQEQ